MSFSSNRDALRLALQSSLNDVLLDVGMDSRNLYQNPYDNFQHANVVLPQRSHPSSFAGFSGAGFDSPLLPSRQGALVAQSLGFGHVPLASPMGLSSTDGLLLAAAAANERKQILQQARASLLQQQIVEENKRILLEKSYLSMIRNAVPGMSVPSASLKPTPTFQTQTSSAASQGISQSKTLEVLGSNLRSTHDPYIDISDMPDPDPEDSILRRTRGGISEPFPEKLHRMLKEVEGEGKTDIVSFYSHGRAFGIHDMDRFVSEIMPKYFKQTKWNSFARQLNLYGFIRVCSGPDAGGYYHELFLKGRPNLCLHMRRVGVPHGEDRRKFRPKSKHTEPDFYAMKRIEMA